MLAPRKKLWSTPAEVIDRALDLLSPEEGDVLFDIGAGDGRFLLRAALTSEARCVGIEIDETRGNEATDAITAAGLTGDKCRLIIGNALDQDYSSGTLFFLYLIPRGLRIILPYLQNLGKKIRVVTYMSPFPEEVVPAQIVKVTTANHEGADWPLWVYELGAD
jgi:ubiquinone/menaquinone biosynthesis C-methylase UbiE